MTANREATQELPYSGGMQIGNFKRGTKGLIIMSDSFYLPVSYKGEDLSFSAYLKKIGYTYSIVVDVYGTEVAFEPDEERNFRAIMDQEWIGKQLNIELL